MGAPLLDEGIFNIFKWEKERDSKLIPPHLSFFSFRQTHPRGVQHLVFLSHPPSLSPLSLALFAERDTCVIDSSPKPVRLDQFAELYPIIKAGLRVGRSGWETEGEWKRERVNEKEG